MLCLLVFFGIWDCLEVSHIDFMLASLHLKISFFFSEEVDSNLGSLESGWYGVGLNFVSLGCGFLFFEFNL